MKLLQPTSKQSHSAKKSPTNHLGLAIALALAAPLAGAATFNVTEPTDDGTGLVNNTLSWAILQANTTVGSDTIELNTDVNITGVMKRLIDSDVTLSSDATNRTISGNNQFRPLFIKSGQVTIQDLNIQNGLARGGRANGGGLGAGLGGALFMYDGNLSLNQVSIGNSSAIGGQFGGSTGGAGMFGGSLPGCSGGGGLFADCNSSNGAYGGYGNYRNNDPMFGAGGDYSYYGNATSGGFGAGGGESYYGLGGNGGFGGGGGHSYYDNGGLGGFGAGGGLSEFYLNSFPGFGANNNWAAGFGGGLFIRSGTVVIQDSTFSNNQANSYGSPGNEPEGFGGGIFVMHTLTNSNGNNQGMPANLPAVSACGLTFNNNTADTDPGTANNNDDVFDDANLIVPSNGFDITAPCGPPAPEMDLTGNGIEIVSGDQTPELADGTDFNQRAVGGPAPTQQFTITNNGLAELTLSGMPLVDISGDPQFTITTQPADSSLDPAQSVTFTVTYTPDVIGSHAATVSIANDDSNENPYEFLVQGEAAPDEPEIDVKGNDISIPDGDVTPQINDFTSMGQATANFDSITRTFTLENSGVAALVLSGNPPVSVVSGSGQFSVSEQPQATSLNTNDVVSFAVTFTPTNVGIDTATIEIINNDTDEALYDFVLEAEGLAPMPVLQVSGNGNTIQDGDTSPSAADLTDFEFTPVTGGQVIHTFDLTNTGTGTINLFGPLLQTFEPFELFSNITDFNLDAGETTSFSLRFNPTEAGQTPLNTVVIFDENFNPLHSFNVTGYGQPTLKINAATNYLQEGEIAAFQVTSDVATDDTLQAAWQVSGDVTGGDFAGGVLPTGSLVIENGPVQIPIEFQTIQDGLYEGPEFFTVNLSSSDPRTHIGFPAVSGGVIDDDLIFADGFSQLALTQLLKQFENWAHPDQDLPVCTASGCDFLGSTVNATAMASMDLLATVIWFENTLILNQPNLDWDGDGLPNHHDLNPFGIPQHMLLAFKQTDD